MSSSPADLAIRCGALIDGSDSAPREDVVITIRDGEVASVTAPEAAPPAERELDLADLTVLPGLVNCHDHLSFDLGDFGEQLAAGTVPLALRAARNCASALRAGITTLRDLGAPGTLAVTCREAVAEGLIPGPRLQVAGTWITRTGGHCWVSAREADGSAEITRAVREQARAGVDWIKLAITGGFLTPGSTPTAPGFTTEEIKAAIAAAHFVGLPVTAHIHGGPGLRDAIEAGIDCVEHGLFASREELELMREREIPLVSTYGVLEVGVGSDKLDAEARAQMERGQEAALETLASCRELGLTVGLGTDLIHDDLVREMGGLVAAGYTAAEALHAGTGAGASVLGREDLGVLAPGRLADLLAVPGRPDKDLEALRDVRLVIKDGAVVHDPMGLTRKERARRQ